MVALESFTQVTPSTTPTTWRRWTTPGKLRRVAAMSGAATPSAAAAAAAASEFATLCSPFRARAPTGHNSSWPAPVSSHSTPCVTPASRARRRRRPAAQGRGRRPAAQGRRRRGGGVGRSRSDTAKPPRRAAAGQAGGDRRHGAGVVEVHQGEVGGRLVLEDAQLGVDVARVAAVPVDVVLGEVEQHGDVGPEALDVLELEARQLGHHDRLGVDPAGQVGQRPAHVAGHFDRAAGVAQDLAGELGRRGLAVGPGDGDPAVGQKARGELDLAPDRQRRGPTPRPRSARRWARRGS